MTTTALALGGPDTRAFFVAPPLVLAPMAGITDTTYRLLLRRIGGVGLVTMEFVSSEGLTRGAARTERLLRFVHARIALPGLPGVTDPAPLVQPTRP